MEIESECLATCVKGLPACRFCGSADIYIGLDDSVANYDFFVGCNACKCRGPAGHCRSVARDLWRGTEETGQPDADDKSVVSIAQTKAESGANTHQPVEQPAGKGYCDHGFGSFSCSICFPKSEQKRESGALSAEEKKQAMEVLKGAIDDSVDSDEMGKVTNLDASSEAALKALLEHFEIRRRGSDA